MGRILSFICKTVGALTLLALIASAGLLVTAGSWLPAQEAPRPADYIVVLAGDPSRPLYAADLYEQGLAPRVLVSRPWRREIYDRLDSLGVRQIREEERNAAVLQAKGVPESALDFFGQANLSTAQEAMELQQRFAGSDASFLVVTSPFHVRRTRLIFDDILTCCELQVVGSPYEPFPDDWWNDRKSAMDLLLEMTKTLYYLGGGVFSSGMGPSLQGEPSAQPSKTSPEPS